MLATVILSFGAPGSAAVVAFSLGDGGTSIVYLGDVTGSATPVARPITNAANGANVALTDIDFEKETGHLYGVSATEDAVYRLDPLTGVATFRASLPVSSDAAALLADWNNAIDRMRIVSSTESNGDNLNFVFNQDADTVTQNLTHFFAAGDPNAGTAPRLVGNAYRDAVATGGVGNVPPQGGVQLGIDAATDALVSMANNAGVLTTLAGF